MMCSNCNTINDSFTKTIRGKIMSARPTTLFGVVGMINDYTPVVGIKCPQCSVQYMRYMVLEKHNIAIKKRNGNLVAHTNEELATMKMLLLYSVTFHDLFDIPYAPPGMNNLSHQFIEKTFMTSLMIIPPQMRQPVIDYKTQMKRSSYVGIELTAILARAWEIVSEQRNGNDAPNEISYRVYSSRIANLFFGSEINKLSNKEEQINYLMDLSGKNSVIRVLCMSKVHRKSGRETLRNNDSMRFGEVRMTTTSASKIFIDYPVTRYNIGVFQRIKDNHVQGVYPWIREIVSSGVRITSAMSMFDEHHIKVGDNVTSQLIGGMLVMITRQPALMPGNKSMYRVTINNTLQGVTAGMEMNSTTVAGPMGGDFDGDFGMLNYCVPKMGDATVLLGMYNNVRLCKGDTIGLVIANGSASGLYSGTMWPKVVPIQFYAHHMGRHRISRAKIEEILDRTAKLGGTTMSFISAILDDKLSIHRIEPGSETGNFGSKPLEIVNGRIVDGVLDQTALSSMSTDTIQTVLLANHTKAEVMDSLSMIQMAGTILSAYYSLTVDFTSFGYDTEFHRSFKGFEAGVLAATETFIENSRSLPAMRAVDDIRPEFRRLEKCIDLKDIHKNGIGHMIGGARNPTYQAILAKKGSTGIFSSSLGSSGVTLVPTRETIYRGDNRLSNLCPFNSTDPRHNGYLANSTYSGYSTSDIITVMQTTRQSALERKDGTKEPGTHSRKVKCALSPYITGCRGGLYRGSVVNNQTLTIPYIPLSGGMVNEIAICKTSSILMWYPDRIKATFDADASGRFFDLYCGMYDGFRTRYNNTAGMFWDNVDYLETTDLLINFDYVRWPKSSNDHGNAEAILDLYWTFVCSVIGIQFGLDWGKFMDDLPDYSYKMTSGQVINLLANLPPNKVVMAKYDDLDDMLTNLYYKMVGCIPPSGANVGMMAAVGLSQRVTQDALDAPKKGKLAKKTVERFVRSTSGTYNPKVPVKFIVDIHDRLPDYQRFVRINVGQLSPQMTIMHGEVPTEEYDIYKIPDVSSYVTIRFIFSITELNKRSINTTEIIAAFVEDGIMVHISSIGVYELIIMGLFAVSPDDVIPEGELFSRAASIKVRGIENIHAIDIGETTYNSCNEDGTYSTLTRSYLEVTCLEMSPIYEIPGIDYGSIICTNLAAQSHFFGSYSASIVMMHLLRSQFPEHPAGNLAILSAAATINGTFTGIDQNYTNKANQQALLLNMATQNGSLRMFNAPIGPNADTGDAVSSMITGSNSFTGTGSVVSYKPGLLQINEHRPYEEFGENVVTIKGRGGVAIDISEH